MTKPPTEQDPLRGLMFLTREEAETIEAVAARIIPGTPDNPGAREAHAVVFIDRTLAGYAAHLQVFYRRGIATLDELSRHQHGSPFRKLSADLQDVVMRSIDGEIENGRPTRMAQFFEVVREHTLEGTFCDPKYGGNLNAVGWKMIGFPGAHWGYSADEMVLGVDSRALPVETLTDIEARIAEQGQ